MVGGAELADATYRKVNRVDNWDKVTFLEYLLVPCEKKEAKVYW